MQQIFKIELQLNDWTLADNSHRFKVQCTVSPENGPEIVTHGVAIKKANAEKVAALKMKNRLEVLNVPQQNGILDCREAGGNVSKRDTSNNEIFFFELD